MSNDLNPYEKWMKDQLKDVDVPDMNQAWEQMSNLLQPGITNVPTIPHKPWFGKWWIAGSVIVAVTTVILFTKKSFKNAAQKEHIKTSINNNSNPITQNNQNNIELINNSIQNKLIDTLNSKREKEKEQNQRENISLKNKIEIGNKVAIKDKSLISTINSKNKLVVVNNKGEEKRIITQNKKYKKNGNQSLQKDGLKNIYTKSNKNKLTPKSTAAVSNNLSKSSIKKFRNKNQFNPITHNIKKNYSTSNINKDKKSIKSKSTDNNTILNASNKPLAKETNAEKQLKNIQYNVNTFTPTAVVLPNPTIINTNQQLSTLLSKQLASSKTKKWSARVGATINAPFAIGGREYNDHTFTSRDGSIINFIPSLHFNIKYAITPKWSIGFAPQFFVQQVPYSNALSAIIKAPVPADSGATLTTVVRLANMYYSHFPLTINYNLSKKFEVQAGIDLAILNKVVAYKNEKYESPTRTSFSPENSTSLTQEELQTLHKFDIRALFGITYTLGNSLHFGLQFTQAFGSYLKQKLAPALSSDPAAGISDPLPTKSTNASFQLFTRYDFNILKRKSKKDEVVNNTNQKQFNESKSIQTDSVKAKKWSIRVGLTLNVPIPIGAQTFDPISPYYKQAPLGGTVHKWTLNFIPWPHVDFRYKLNPKWSIELGIQPSVQQLAANNIVYRKVSSSAPGDTSISIIRLSKMFYFRMPLSINYSINKKFEVQAGIDPGILHTPLGYYETRSYRTLPPTYDLTNKYPTVVWPEYDVLRRIEVKAKLGAIYNVNNNLHCGVSFSQAFNFYVERPDQQLAPIFPSDPAPVYRKNFALNLFFKYDLDLLKKKNKQKKN